MNTRMLPGPRLQIKERENRISRGSQPQHLYRKILTSRVKMSPECLPSANASCSLLGKTFHFQKAACELCRVSPCF